jgi:dipeptidyl aminopeptidase/acylaminoacyl peptidase
MRKAMAIPALAFLASMMCLSLAAQSRRPMTFEDLQQMKRLGDTAVSPDGKWLAYSAVSVNLGLNTKTPALYVQPIAGGEAYPIAGTLPGDSGVQFSPDGKKILFLSSRSGTQQIWLADFDPGNAATTNPLRLTAISTEAADAIWSPDGRSIAFTSAVYPDCPAYSHANANVAANDKTAKAIALAKAAAEAAAANDTAETERAANDAAALAAEANSAATTADPNQDADRCNAARDAYLAASKVKAQIFTHLLYRHWDHYTGDKRSHLFIVPSSGGPVRDLTPNDPRDVPPFSLDGGGCGCAFSPDSKELAFTENLDPEPAISVNADIFTLDLTNPEAQPVKVSTSPGGDFNPAYSPDGKWLAWRSQARAGYESDRFRLMLYDRATRGTRELLPSFDRWIIELAWAQDSKTIYFVAEDKGEAPIYRTNLLGSLVHRYGKAAGHWSDIHPLNFGGREVVVGTLSRVTRPAEAAYGDLLVMDDNARTGPALSSFEPRLITHLNDALLAKLDLPAMDSFWFTASDKTRLQGFIIKPPAFDQTRQYPVKFLIHGGPQGAWGNSWSFRWNAELFAANGYVVVMVNPRGSTGYGQAIIDGVNGDWGGKPYTDLMQGLDYAEQHYFVIDKNRECALGASYGGYMANWILGHTGRFRCIVTHDGMFNPESAYGSTEELWFNEWEFRGKPWDYYGKPDNENPYRVWSPALYTQNFRTPTLVIHNQLDYRLDVTEGFQLFTTLQRLKVPSKMLYFPDEGHWVLKPQNSQLWYRTVNDWVDQWTK